MKRFLALLSLLPHLALADATRVVVPITEVVLPNGDLRYSVPVSVGRGSVGRVSVGGAASFPALLDTGSTGLKVFRAMVPAQNYQDSHIASASSFSAGDRLTGTIGTAQLNIGGASTDAPVRFELVDQAACMDFRPRCGAATLPARDYGIGGDGIAGQGFQAILGISLQTASDSENPLVHIGAKRWLIELPEPNQHQTGALIINPDDNDVHNAQSFQLAHSGSGWLDVLPGCLNNLSTTQRVCGPTILDTGSPGMIVYIPNALNATLWNVGENASLGFSAANQASTNQANLTMPFKIDQSPGTGLLQQAADTQQSYILSGFLPFFYDDVLYDAAMGRIALQPRPDAPNPAASTMAPPMSVNSAIEVIEMNAPGAIAQAAPNGMPVVITPSQ
ncbi:MAG: hypothetical protein POG74_03670 [Acidocella sp.]|nr:hypothetical protein [Acidocella sp.]